ncbi:MAG: Maf family protein [Gammaproteobacteria bacterium]
MIRLASVSPRRRELLAQIGVPHVIAGADIDETVLRGELPHDYVVRMARTKALAIWNQDQSLPVLAADTTVVLDGVTLGKPRDRDDALHMLARLSGRTHEVLTAVALVVRHALTLRVSASAVRFRKLMPEECAAYWQTGEPRDKAGAYAIQGRAAVFIESVSGSYSGVMGLPLFETTELLRQGGVSYWCTMDA